MKRNASKSVALSLDRIIDEAVRLLADEGLEGVSLRRLAARLGVRAPSLYWHVPDKATLLSGMMERIFTACVDDVPPCARWQDWMRNFAAVLWRTQAATRDFAPLLITSPLDDAQMERIEALLATRVAGLDIPVADALRIQSSVQVLMTGWSIFAHTQFSPALSRRMDFHARALHDLELLLEGEAAHLDAPRPRRLRASAPSPVSNTRRRSSKT